MSEYGSVTQCPHCKTSFHVGPIQLEAAQGHVRCGGCLKVFDANKHFLIEQKPLFGGVSEESETEEEISIIPGALEEEDDADLMPPEKDSTDSLIEEQTKEEAQRADEYLDEEQPEPENLSEEDERSGARVEEDQEYLTQESESEENLEADENIAEAKDPLAGLDAEQAEESGHSFSAIEEVAETENELVNKEPAAEEKEPIDSEDEEIDHILDEAFDDLEQNLASDQRQEESSEEAIEAEEEWQPLIAERTGAKAEEPEFNDQPVIDEEKELAEQLFVDSKKRRSNKKLSASWVAVTLVLFVVLFAQSMYWQPGSLRQYKIYNQISLNYCALLPCRELILQDLSQLYITGLVRPSDEYNNALSVQVELRNRSDQPQRFPYIELAFTDLRGQKISLRRFSPLEYLRAETAGRTVLEPFQRVQIEMELYDPGASAISYEFNLLYLN